jgi:hypothetical protein
MSTAPCALVDTPVAAAIMSAVCLPPRHARAVTRHDARLPDAPRGPCTRCAAAEAAAPAGAGLLPEALACISGRAGPGTNASPAWAGVGWGGLGWGEVGWGGLPGDTARAALAAAAVLPLSRALVSVDRDRGSIAIGAASR